MTFTRDTSEQAILNGALDETIKKMMKGKK
jgi:hypothetical protein